MRRSGDVRCRDREVGFVREAAWKGRVVGATDEREGRKQCRRRGAGAGSTEDQEERSLRAQSSEDSERGDWKGKLVERAVGVEWWGEQRG